ncbi:hypothetical protein LOTGIDRAFT_118149 [Lottia gigantea]|uniref:O(6)-methylguanine-induced apoptosis 2 n=1 Tax=Lottia gigantea TaxID=225164 RepID=V4ACC7_LOTGI|nr:hypothetical protein LOTGIDRAFT_118149 [Lottia gigantea]ESO94482.1 hypothetical protein LOTGIDRAFT_118149 [Lottia gigantea]
MFVIIVGHGVVAANSSIPTKYQTIVTDNSDKKGFTCKAKRFQSTTLSENPGPCNYIGHDNFDKESNSFSKKGTGSFASKSKRQIRYEMSNGPGPGIYGLPDMLSSRQDFNRSGSTSTFQKPIAQTQLNKKGNPAPNLYQVGNLLLRRKSNNICGDAAFKSKTRRDIIDVKESKRMPAPWQYNVKDDILYSNPKIPESSFKSRTTRNIMSSPSKNPGPGAYFPAGGQEYPERTIFPRKHYLCISAPAMPLPKTPPLPGPGSYELVDFEGYPKHYMSGSAFVSTTSRWTNITDAEQSPGPAQYKPAFPGKQTFIYNASGKWIC